MNAEVQYWMHRLGLVSHPEGGYFREIYRSDDNFLPPDIGGSRSISTAIYYLLTEGHFSAFHRIRSDECWHFYAGDPLFIHIIFPDGTLETKLLFNQTHREGQPFAFVPKNCWFAAKSKGAYSLVGCTVAPGFAFEDFELANRHDLELQYPAHSSVIESFTRV